MSGGTGRSLPVLQPGVKMLNPVQPPQPSAAMAKEAWGSLFILLSNTPGFPVNTAEPSAPWAYILNPVGALLLFGLYDNPGILPGRTC